ncbi:hypothetical protein Droror1_Dr00022528 [Drosera rotundifolia]
MVGGTNNFFLAETGMKCDARVDFLIRFLEPFGYPLWFAQNWRGNDPCSCRPGITCSDGNITIISLHGKGLAGTISPIIASLTTGEVVNLSHNSIIGIIPKQLTLIPNLMKLDVSFSQLDGKIHFQPH